MIDQLIGAHLISFSPWQRRAPTQTEDLRLGSSRCRCHRDCLVHQQAPPFSFATSTKTCSSTPQIMLEQQQSSQNNPIDDNSNHAVSYCVYSVLKATTTFTRASLPHTHLYSPACFLHPRTNWYAESLLYFVVCYYTPVHPSPSLVAIPYPSFPSSIANALLVHSSFHLHPDSLCLSSLLCDTTAPQRYAISISSQSSLRTTPSM